MKRCPECRRDYYDETLLYCLDDGNALLEGPGSGSGPIDEPQTAILHDTPIGAEAATQVQIHTNDKPEIPPQVRPRAAAKRNLLIAGVVGITLIAALGIGVYFYFVRATSTQIRSIAVLPFQNASGNVDSEYLSDGLAESLIYRLSQLPDLKVSPASSVMRYKGKEFDAQKIALELGVGAVMSGRMVQRGDSLTLSVELIDVANNQVIWGEQYERKMADLLATQREIATTITQKLQLKFAGTVPKGITKKYTENNEAYQAYLKGRYYWNRRTSENLKKALEQFKTAADKDPNFALAYVGIADCYALMPEYAGASTSEVNEQARAYVERAIDIDDQLAEAHATLGLINDQTWQLADAEREYKRAIELNPKYATAYHWYCLYLRGQGRFDESAVMIKRAQELDPLSSIISINISEMYQLQNNHQAAIENSLKIIELDPTFSFAYEYLGQSYLNQGRTAEAVANLEKAVELGNRASVRLRGLGYGYGIAGKRTEALSIAKELEAKYAKNEAPGQYVAAVYAGIGDKDTAFEWLEKDFQSKEDLASVRWRIHYGPLRDDPRFKDLLRRIGLPE